MPLTTPAHSIRQHCAMLVSVILCAVVLAIPAHACQPPMPGQYSPTESEYTNLYLSSSDTVVVARATSHWDNGQANATVPTGEGQARLAVRHRIKGGAPFSVSYTLGGCGYGRSWNRHIPLDRDTLLFISKGRVIYGIILESNEDSLLQAQGILERASSTPFPQSGK